ncbi:hypothetical protein HPB47_002637 [Ixodes persulcatus]|uniref:Uncharacterized protein n=1 Tax=Ixodes persulcatus TaxID=34615 RepID=A0AC60PKN1_IXOPE|nr:hypothetical protein HPB47_002637 [Ixodes persulcatus]
MSVIKTLRSGIKQLPTESKQARQPEGTAQVERRQSFAHVARDARHKTPSTGEATDAALLRMVSRLFRAVRQLAQARRHTPEAKFALEESSHRMPKPGIVSRQTQDTPTSTPALKEGRQPSHRTGGQDVPTVLQWNCRGLTARHSELTLHLQRYPSPVLALVEAGLPGKRTLPGYVKLTTQSIPSFPHGCAALFIRQGVPYFQVDTSQLCTLSAEFVAARVSIGKRTFHVLVGYVRPDGTEWPTDDLLTWCKNIDGDLLLCGDLNAHSEAWGSRKTDKRGDAVTKMLEELNLVVANDGGPTFFRPPSTYSAIDVTAHTPTLELAWATAPDTRGSDHFPIQITVKGCQMVRKVVRSCTNWDVFRAALDTSRADIATAIVQALQEATHTTRFSEWLPNPDLTFLNLQAARTRAQRKYRRTKNPEDKTRFNRVSAKLRRHAKALVRARWKLMCRNINAHSSLHKLWRVLGAMTGSCRTRYALQVLALAANITEQLAAERLCALYAPAEAPGKPGTPNLSPGPLDAPFTVQELESALRRCRKKSATGPDGIPYQALTNLPDDAQEALCMTGFRRGLSAQDSILDLTSDLEENKNKRRNTVAVFLDVERAYDGVPLSTILRRLTEAGLTGKIQAFLANFLAGRKIQVCSGRTVSSTRVLRRGLPQGSVLSPVIFNIVMAQLPCSIPPTPLPVQISLYADDVCLWVSGIYTSQIQRSIQDAIHAVDNFLTKSGLNLSRDKTAWMSIRGRHFRPPDIKLAGERITRVTRQRFLGIVLTDRLRWAQAAAATVTTCRPAMNAVRRMTGVTWGCTERIILAAQTALVTSRILHRLPYMSPSPTDLEGLEQLHRQGLRTALGIPKAAKNNLVLHEAGLEPLERQSWERSLFQLARLSTTPPGRWFLRRIRDRTTASWSKVVEVFLRVAAPLTMPQSESRAPPWEVPKIASEVRIKYLRSKQDKPLLVIKELVEAHLKDRHSGKLQLYTDGSVNHSRTSSTAAYHIPKLSLEWSGRLHTPTSSTTAELVAMEKALLAAARLPPQPMVLLTDSRCAIQKVANAETVDPATTAAALDVRWHLLQEKPEKSLPKGTLTGLSRAAETLVRRLRTDTAYTNEFLAKMGKRQSSSCPQCRAEETIHHILCVCPAYETQRQVLRQRVKEGTQVTTDDLLFPEGPRRKLSTCPRRQRKATARRATRRNARPRKSKRSLSCAEAGQRRYIFPEYDIASSTPATAFVNRQRATSNAPEISPRELALNSKGGNCYARELLNQLRFTHADHLRPRHAEPIVKPGRTTVDDDPSIPPAPPARDVMSVIKTLRSGIKQFLFASMP